MANGTPNTAYSATLTATGGTTPYTWSIVSGSMPAGLALTSSTGVISGTPTGIGTSNFTIQAKGADSLASTRSLSLTVGAPPSITTALMANGTQNAAYNATLVATGGTTPYTWSIISGALPTGLLLAPSTGVISGTPTAIGTSNFTVQDKGADSLASTKSLSLTVIVPVSITTTSLANGTQNLAYSATLAATGGTTPYTWSIISGALPAGLAVAPSTGVISGTPTTTGASNFTVSVTDANSLTSMKSLSLIVTPPLSITTTSLANSTQSAAYSATLAATGGTSPYTWSIVSGALPAGLSLAPSTGVISGTPTGTTGTSNFTAVVTDTNSLTSTKSLSLIVTPPLSITTTSLANSSQNAPYSATLAATGGTIPYTWSIVSGALPVGLTLAPSTGAISGTPTTTGTSSFTVGVTDTNSLTTTKSLSLIVTPPLSITTASLANSTQNAPYSATLAATGGTSPYTWSIVSGVLAVGLSLAPSTGSISGTPTGTIGTSNFTVGVTDTNSLTTTKSLSLTVTPPLSNTTTSLANSTQNAPYSATLAATGGTIPYTWSIVSGALPAGLSLAPSTGVISGTPTGTTGTSTFTASVTDANSLTSTKSLSLIVTPPLSITTTSLANSTQNAVYSSTMTATGGTIPYTWSIVSGALPAGLVLAPSTGAISGTPTTTGASNFTVSVTDANSLTASKVLSLTSNANGGGGSGIGLLQSNAIQGSGVGSVSVAFPTSNTAGNLIIAFVRMSSTGQSVTMTDSVGNVYTDAVSQVQTADGHQVHIFYAKNVAGGANTVKATFSATNNHPWLAIYEYRGLSTTIPLDQTAAAQGTNVTPDSGLTAMTVSANELLFAGTGLPSAYAGTVTAGSGYTMLQQDTNSSPADNESVIVTSTGAYASTFSASSNTNWSAVLATFKP